MSPYCKKNVGFKKIWGPKTRYASKCLLPSWCFISFLNMPMYHYLCLGPTCFFLEVEEDLYLGIFDLFTLGTSQKKNTWSPLFVYSRLYCNVAIILSTIMDLWNGSYFHYPIMKQSGASKFYKPISDLKFCVGSCSRQGNVCWRVIKSSS